MKSYFKPKKNNIIYLILFLIFFLKNNSYSEEITGYAKVIDGDTIRIKGNKIRLYGIDAPEKNQMCKKNNIKLIYFSTGYVYEGTKGNYSENDPVKPFNKYGLSKLGGECSVAMYSNSLILRITMTEKPFLHKKAYKNLKSNFMFHEDLVKILPKIINQKGILNVGGKSQSVFSFAKKSRFKVKGIKAKKNLAFPLNQTMNLAKLKRIIS